MSLFRWKITLFCDSPYQSTISHWWMLNLYSKSPTMSKTKIISAHLKIVFVVTNSEEIFSFCKKLMSWTICFSIFRVKICFLQIIGNCTRSFVVKRLVSCYFCWRLYFLNITRSSIVSFHHLNYLEGIFFYYWDTGEGEHHEGSYLFSLITEEAFKRIRKLVIVYFGWQIVQIMAPFKIDLVKICQLQSQK